MSLDMFPDSFVEYLIDNQEPDDDGSKPEHDEEETP